MTIETTLSIAQPDGEKAMQRIQAHPAFMSAEDFDAKFVYTHTPLMMSDFMIEHGGLITRRHDLVENNPGNDFLVNLMIEMVVLHINAWGEYSLHRWERGQICSQANRLPLSKEQDILEELLGN